jgi:hypothetical protein
MLFSFWYTKIINLFVQDAFILWDTYGYPIDLTEVSFTILFFHVWSENSVESLLSVYLVLLLFSVA